MTNLVRGVVAVALLGAFVAVIYARSAESAPLIIANDSQSQLNIDNTANLSTDDKKLIKKTVSERRVVPKAESAATAPATSAAAAELSKGSFIATAYCLPGRTATGQSVRRGLIAADPRVLRLGSRVQLGAGGYSGQYLVSDTGGAIRGRRIDIWVPSCAEARRFGRRTVAISAAN